MSISSSSQDNQPMYTVTARKWRSKRFAEVVGQEHVTQTLRNAIQTGRIHHAYIFNGPRGVGKTSIARILAKALNCQNPGPDAEPCNACPSCMDIASGRSLDVIEIDGASNNSVEDVRKLRENAKYPPVNGTYKMYIIDEVHMLSTSAFNALLKTLEEPPRHLIFVFATTEPHKVPATILSRCQRFDFRRMQIDDIVKHLGYIATQEGITIDEESLTVIAKKGDGSMRDSQSIFDQVVSFCGMNVSYAHVNEALNLIDQEFFFTISHAIRQHDVPAVLDISRQIFIRGYDLQECLIGLAEHFRNILTVLATGETSLIETSRNFMEHYKKESVYFTQSDVLQLMNTIITTEQALRYAPQPRLRFEFALIQMAKMDSAIDLSTLLKEIADLKKKLETGTPLSYKQEGASAHSQQKQEAREASIAYDQSQQDEHKGLPLSSTPTAPALSPGSDVVIPEVTPSSTVDYLPAENSLKSPQESFSVGQQMSHVSLGADIIQERWKAFLEESPLVDKAFKRMATTGLFTIEFADNEIYLTGTLTVVGNTLLEKKSDLAEALKEFYGGQINVHIKGADEKNNSLSIFEEYASVNKSTEQSYFSNSALVRETTESITADAPSSVYPTELKSQMKTINGSSDARHPDQADSNGQPVNGKMAEHPLDRAIIDLFGAVEIPIR